MRRNSCGPIVRAHPDTLVQDTANPEASMPIVATIIGEPERHGCPVWLGNTVGKSNPPGDFGQALSAYPRPFPEASA